MFLEYWIADVSVLVPDKVSETPGNSGFGYTLNLK